jgi:DNA (cytosine-5)-methyltransferase 1
MISQQQITHIILKLKDIELAFVDLFSGAGGTTTGVEHAEFNGKKIAKVILCINHDKFAIESHTGNHPDSIHLVEDVRAVKMDTLVPLITQVRQAYPKLKLCLWASLECTNFSKAKGGQPRDADSRTLAWDLLRYIGTIKPERIYIENVEEFMAWGPLDQTGRPVSKKAGEDYLKWIKAIIDCGYKYEFRIINSADLGAYTARKRYFGQFAQDGLDIKWPVQTHEKRNKKLSGGFKDWMAVKDVLDLNNHGQGVLTRKKPLSEKTLERILIGACKFVSPSDPQFFIKYHSTGKNVLDLHGPASSLTTKDRLALIQTQFIDKQYSSGTKNSSVDVPAGAITTIPKMNLVSCQPFLVNANSSTAPSKSLDEPCFTVTTGRTHFIINPQWFNRSAISVENPCPTIIARMDKAPLYVATAEQVQVVNVYVVESITRPVQPVIQTKAGNLIYIMWTGDSVMTRALKLFMAQNGIVDIKMRMLEIEELLRIQGFPDGYVLKGTKTSQKKFIGNSVVPLVAERLIEACVA